MKYEIVHLSNVLYFPEYTQSIPAQGSRVFFMIHSLSRMGTWKTYSIDDGLPSLRIEHIAEDHEGYIWFATWDNGASRFDGDAFQNFTTKDGLIDDQVFFIQQDRQERLWFGTSKGVCWYDGADFHPLESDGILGRRVQFIYEDRQGRIWLGGEGTLGYYDGTAFHDLTPLYREQYQQPSSAKWISLCRGIAQDPQGHLWFGFKHLFRYDGASFHRYKKKEGFPRAEASYAVGQDPAGTVIYGLGMHPLISTVRAKNSKASPALMANTLPSWLPRKALISATVSPSTRILRDTCGLAVAMVYSATKDRS